MAEDYDVMEEGREEVAKLRKSKIYCRFIMYIMTSIYHFALGKYTWSNMLVLEIYAKTFGNLKILIWLSFLL